MKIFFLLLAVFFILTVERGQTQITFQKMYGGGGPDYSFSVQQTSDGGFVMAGITGGFGAGSWDIYIVKTNSNGTLEWAKTFGGAGSDRGQSIQQTNDGGFIITGSTTNFGPGGNDDVILVKTYSDGTLQWTKSFGGSKPDGGTFVRQTSDGGFIITGYTFSFGLGINGNGDAYLVKTTSDGTLQWTRTFGGTGRDDGYSIQQTNDGGFIITGGTMSYGAGYYDVYLIKTDSAGNLQWTKTFGGQNYDYGYSVQQTNDGGFVIVGSTESYGAGNKDVYLIKTDSVGNLQWTKTFGAGSNDAGYSIQQVKDGGFVIGGYTDAYTNSTGGTYGAAYLIKTDLDGILEWTKYFGDIGNDVGGYVQQTTDGGFIISGETTSFGAQGFDVYLIKTDSTGNAGCNDSAAYTIISSGGIQSTGGIQDTGGMTIAHPIQMSSGGIETIFCYMGINYFARQGLMYVYPNPFSTQTYLQVNTNLENAILTFFNPYGQKIKQISIPSIQDGQTIILQRNNLPSGLYFIRLTEDDKTIATDKLVITD